MKVSFHSRFRSIGLNVCVIQVKSSECFVYNAYFSDVQTEEWRTQCQELQEVIQVASRSLAAGETRAIPNKFRHLTYSAVERQFNHALGKQLSKYILLLYMGVKLDFLLEGTLID
jgi:hypothetical protein